MYGAVLLWRSWMILPPLILLLTSVIVGVIVYIGLVNLLQKEDVLVVRAMLRDLLDQSSTADSDNRSIVQKE